MPSRRTIVGSAALLGSLLLPRRPAVAAPASIDIAACFDGLPGDISFKIFAPSTETAPQFLVAQNSAQRLFVGSAIKTFILAQCLRALEAGQLSEDDQHAIDDAVRSPSSPVFLNLTGTTTLRSVLEAMIAHSDNTATDVALALVGPDRVRDLVRQAGLGSTRVPDSTRRLVSYLAGAEPGTDLGWTQLQRLLAGGPAPAPCARRSTTSRR